MFLTTLTAKAIEGKGGGSVGSLACIIQCAKGSYEQHDEGREQNDASCQPAQIDGRARDPGPRGRRTTRVNPTNKAIVVGVEPIAKA